LASFLVNRLIRWRLLLHASREKAGYLQLSLQFVVHRLDSWVVARARVVDLTAYSTAGSETYDIQIPKKLLLSMLLPRHELESSFVDAQRSWVCSFAGIHTVGGS
jgi:hypothetical protein